MGWPLEHLLALRHRRVTGADQYTEFRHQEPGRQRCATDFSQWLLEVFLYVVAERFQRRDVEHLRMVIEFTRKGLFEEVIDAGEKGGERLAGAGRRSNENISPRLNSRPSLRLDIGRVADCRIKPFGNERVKSREGMARDRTTPPEEALPARAVRGHRCGNRFPRQDWSPAMKMQQIRRRCSSRADRLRCSLQEEPHCYLWKPDLSCHSHL